MNYRFIPFKKYDPYFKTGLNQALMDSVAEKGRPVIFLAGWNQKCVNLGRSQDAEKEVNLRKAEKNGITIVRRQGGGGTTFLTPEGEITWGIVAPEGEFPDDVNKVYENVCSTLASQLEEIGIDAEHEPINDVVTSDAKISGATLKRKDGVVYIGGTLLYENDPEEMFTYLTPNEDKLDDKPIKKFRDRVTSVVAESGASFEEAKNCVEAFLKNGRTWENSSLTENEVETAEKLAEKYRSKEWIFQ